MAPQHDGVGILGLRRAQRVCQRVPVSYSLVHIV